MSRPYYLVALLLCTLHTSVTAKPASRTGTQDRFQLWDSRSQIANQPGGQGVFSTAFQGTTFFGGTFWAADSGRWEALPDSVWTFDTGVGSAIVGDLAAPYPGVDPYKDPSLHAIMEGWIGFDNTFEDAGYFRRLESADPRWNQSICVGAAGGLGGSWSFWCGMFPDEADDQCFASGQGYGNSWILCIAQTFAYSSAGVTISFDTVIETESGYDFVTVEVDTSGAGDLVEVVAYDGSVIGTQNLSLTPGQHLPINTSGSIQIRFCFSSDGAWSDQDGLNPTVCGAFAIDNVSISGGGIAHSTDFETGPDGWAQLPVQPGPGGEWANIVHLSDLPPLLTPCDCEMEDSVLVFEDLVAGGHGLFQDNLAGSPWIDLERFGRTDTPGTVLKLNYYADLPLLNYILAQFNVKYFPQLCGATGKLIESPWLSLGQYYYYGGTPRCVPRDDNAGSQIDFSPFVPPAAQEIRVALGMISYCRFFGNCSGVTNSSPWYDFVSLGVYGESGAPILATRSLNVPQDNFPENGTLDISAPGRFDTNIVRGASSPEAGTSLGDTLVVLGGYYGPNGEGSEVYVQFSVIPGPGVDPVALANFYSRVTFAESRNGQEWYFARMDTAEINGAGALGTNWMTTYHENDPNFSGSDTDKDAGDLDPNGGMTRLANDIFPDDLFTPGTRVHVFFKAKYDVGTVWFIAPDTTGGNYLEWECLPSSMDPNNEWNCLLYVNHFGSRGAAPIIETALASALGGTGANYEGTSWDRYDVQAPSSQQASFGRPLNTEYGANVVQALGYLCIIWNSGNLSAFTLVKEDADILIPWLTLADFNAVAPKQLYLSGDGIARSITTEFAFEPSALELLEELAGVIFNCDTFHEAGCPPGTPLDYSLCVNLDPVTSAPVASALRTVSHVGQGNGCPSVRSFDVLSVGSPDFGASFGDEEYNGAKGAQFASIASDAGGASLDYKIVTDGLSVHYRRDAGTGCTVQSSGRTAVTERMSEVLNYLNHGSGPFLCDGGPNGLGIEDSRVTRYRTSLLGLSPNPLAVGKTGTIAFTMARKSHASIDVFDLGGRLVKTLFNDIAPEGENEVFWNGTDETGRQVVSGVYFYRLKANLHEFSKKMILIRNGGR